MHTNTYTRIHAYRASPPSLLSRLAPVSIDTDGRMRYKERRTRWEMAAADSMSLDQVCSSLSTFLFYKSHVPAPYIYPSVTHRFFTSTASVYHSQPSSIHHGSIWTFSTVSELPPTAIHSFNPPFCQSVAQTRSCLVSWPFTHLLTPEMWPFSHSSFSLLPSIINTQLHFC